MPLKIKINNKKGKKPVKSGNQYFFSIPQVYIDNGIIDPDETYEVYAIKKEADKIVKN